MDSSKSQVKQIDGESLLDVFRLKDSSFFSLYLKSVYKDLTRRSDNQKGVCYLVFSMYYEVPGLICHRIFSVFDKDKDGILSCKEFMDGMIKVFDSSMDNLLDFVFSFFDENEDGFITAEDVRSIFQYIPLQKKHFSEQSFIDRLESQEELYNIISQFFQTKIRIDFNFFVLYTRLYNSTIFLYTSVYLLSKKPFSDRTLKFYSHEEGNEKNCKSLSPQKKPQLIVSPNLHSKFYPSIKILNSPIMKQERDEIRKNISMHKYNNSIAQGGAKIGFLSLENPNLNYLSLPVYNMRANKCFASDENNSNISLLEPLRQLRITASEDNNYNDSTTSPEIILEALSSVVETPRDEISFEGYLIKLVDGKLKKLWFMLYEKYLYCKILLFI